MHRSPALYASVFTLTLAACDAGPEPAAAPSPSSTVVPSAATPKADGNKAPNPSPPVLVPQAEQGETGARNVLLSFARALELGEFGQAYALLGDVARGDLTQQEFERQFADMGRLTVAVPGGEMRGGAGSLYYEVPTTVSGTTGTRLTGMIILRRINDIDGASSEQRRWHIDRVNLAPAR